MTMNDLAERLEQIASDLNFLRIAIEEEDPYPEISVRASDLSVVIRDTRAALRSEADKSGEGARGLGSYAEWDEKLQELYGWTGSAFLAGEKVEDEAQHKANLYSFLCGLIGWFITARDASQEDAR